MTVTAVIQGSIILVLEDSTDFTWICRGLLSRSDDTMTFHISGSKLLSAELDRVRITTVGGSDTFDAGAINISYE